MSEKLKLSLSLGVPASIKTGVAKVIFQALRSERIDGAFHPLSHAIVGLQNNNKDG